MSGQLPPSFSGPALSVPPLTPLVTLSHCARGPPSHAAQSISTFLALESQGASSHTVLETRVNPVAIPARTPLHHTHPKAASPAPHLGSPTLALHQVEGPRGGHWGR